MKKPTSEFGQELKRLRREGTIKYSQAGLANLAGVKASYISQLETGKKNPTTRVIHKLSRHLGVTPNHLLAKVGMVEMDLASTFTSNQNQVRDKMPDLTQQQLEELANYLTYLDFKAVALE